MKTPLMWPSEAASEATSGLPLRPYTSAHCLTASRVDAGGARPPGDAAMEERHCSRLLPAALRAPIQEAPAAVGVCLAVTEAPCVDGPSPVQVCL
jgi:hypothetical protein